MDVGVEFIDPRLLNGPGESLNLLDELAVEAVYVVEGIGRSSVYSLGGAVEREACSLKDVTARLLVV